jgi:hypothetical protein
LGKNLDYWQIFCIFEYNQKLRDMAVKYVDAYNLSKGGWKRFGKEISSHPHFSKRIDIWLDEDTMLPSDSCEVVYVPIEIKSEWGEPKDFFVRFFVVRPTHTNTMTKYWADDIYSFKSFKAIMAKDRTNIIKFVQQNYLV